MRDYEESYFAPRRHDEALRDAMRRQDLPPLNFVVFSERIRQCLVNIGFREPEFYYPYLETPYASPLRDHFHFLLRLVGIKKQFAFWRNMMECYAQK